MLKVLQSKNITFDMVIFSTNDPFISANSDNGDLTNNMVDPDPEMTVQHNLKDTFSRLSSESGMTIGKLVVARTVEEAMQIVAKDCKRVLVTGSLHLVGSALTLFDQKQT
jgi:folylpolyglutamate synthase/dihydropteroate synthase